MTCPNFETLWERQLIILPKALETLRDFSREARKAVGQAIRELQLGKSLTMPLVRPMPSVALGVSEIRIREREGVYRVFYYVRNSRGILLFHAFIKKSKKTPQREIHLARKRLKELLHETSSTDHR
jgi:phage-related protein